MQTQTKNKPGTAPTIARFKLIKKLGSGTQGTVFLARDPDLDRQVAVKLLRTDPLQGDIEALLAEAQTLSRLQHSNILPIYETGQFRKQPYLVLEYIDGFSLQQLLERRGALPVATAVILMSQILAGVAHAHERNIVHRDLTPANILINRNSLPKVSDFGLSRAPQDATPGGVPLAGTLRYMSPEHFSNQPVGPWSDVFALGLIFYEMLTGTHAIDSDTEFSAIYKITHAHIDPPSAARPDLPDVLDKIVCTALSKNRADRYADAMAMKTALDNYRVPRPAEGDNGPDEKSTHSTVKFLLRRMSHKKEFSVLSQHIGDVRKLTAEGGKTAVQRLSNIVLKDVTLTRKLLMVANSAYYGQRKITNVSRAIVLLGMKQVRLCLTSLMVGSQFKDASDELKHNLLNSFASGIIARESARLTGYKSNEDLFICAMFHGLGETLTLYYFPDEYAAIMELMKKQGVDKFAATRRILGIAFHELGVGTGRAWQFPESLIEAMHPLSRGVVDKAESANEMLQRYAAFANEVVTILTTTNAEKVAEHCAALTSRMENNFRMSPQQLDEIIENSQDLITKYARLIEVNVHSSPLLTYLDKDTEDAQAEPA